MTIQKAVYANAAAVQQSKHNQSGSHILRASFSPPAGTDWAVIGCVMADAFDPDSHETLLVNALQALVEITSVENPRFYGSTDASILVNPELPADPTHEWVLHCNSVMSMTVGVAGDKRGRTEKEIETAKPPSNKQWLVLMMVVPDPLDAAKITALESAMEGVQVGGQTAITTAEHLIDGTVRADATSVSL